MPCIKNNWFRKSYPLLILIYSYFALQHILEEKKVAYWKTYVQSELFYWIVVFTLTVLLIICKDLLIIKRGNSVPSLEVNDAW